MHLLTTGVGPWRECMAHRSSLIRQGQLLVAPNVLQFAVFVHERSACPRSIAILPTSYNGTMRITSTFLLGIITDDNILYFSKPGC